MNDSIPLLRHCLAAPSTFTPEALVRAVRIERGIPEESVPPVCVLDFDGDINDWLVQKGLAATCPAWACFHTSMSVVEVEGAQVGVIPRTIGGPYSVLVAEQLWVSGARLIIGLTSAGRVRRSLPVPSLVIPTSAIRDEGTSYHYLPAAEEVRAPERIAEFLSTELRTLGLPVEQGCVWTTDAPYRETDEQLQRHAKNGALAVEMQAASLFAFSQVREAMVGIVAHVTNAVDHKSEPFDKGPQQFGFTLLQCACRAGVKFLRDQH